MGKYNYAQGVDCSAYDMIRSLFPTHFGDNESGIYNISSKGISNGELFIDYKNNGFSLVDIFSTLLKKKVKYKELNWAAVEVFIGLMPESGDYICGVEKDNESVLEDIDTPKGIELFIRKGTEKELADCRKMIGFQPELIKGGKAKKCRSRDNHATGIKTAQDLGWGDEKRIDVIGQNGNTGEHYAAD